jgi:predicted patatin/cPLA2 family phospholipase
VSVIAFSGGSDYGAFGAGFMCGWADQGTRPEFKVVTGISAGALIAPFVFLGPDYDPQLKAVFTETGPSDIYRRRMASLLWSDGLADTTPLMQLIERSFDDVFMRAVAEAHAEGRRLYIGTTNLDADRLVVWNMGAIASSADPRARTLFHQILLASSALPVVFPPVMIDVAINGEWYDELHVDGGVKAQLFVTAATIDVTRLRQYDQEPGRAQRATRLYAVRNAKMAPEPESTSRRLHDLFSRAMSSFIKSQARGDLLRIGQLAEQQGFEFRWVAIPESFVFGDAPEFDTAEMNRLFSSGYKLGIQSDSWHRKAPGFDRY